MNRQEMLQRLAAGESPLEVSIQKWQDIVDGVGIDEGSNNCALCESDILNDNICMCLIVRKTSKTCIYTPYKGYIYVPCKRTAQAELDFLKSLRDAVGDSK